MQKKQSWICTALSNLCVRTVDLEVLILDILNNMMFKDEFKVLRRGDIELDLPVILPHILPTGQAGWQMVCADF